MIPKIDDIITASGATAEDVNGFPRDPLESDGPYLIDGGRLSRRQSTKDGEVIDPLCNFAAQVTEEVVLDDGAETVRAFVVEGRLASGPRLPAVRVPAARFAGMSWVTEQWGLKAVVRAGMNKRDALREAIQLLSPTARNRHIFTHTGWREIDGQWIYLTAGGALGGDDYEVDLGPELARYSLPTTAVDPVEAMQTSLRLLRVAPLTITLPLYAAIFRAPLMSALPADASLWLEGTTGSLKSTLAALALAHYGPFDRLHLPGAWASTANQLERRAFLLKDTVFVIDDYAPGAHDARELDQKAARLLRTAGNGAGRGRLRADLTERPAYPPRGFIISMGEQHPSGQSILARALVIEVNQSLIDMPALTMLQEQAACRTRWPGTCPGWRPRYRRCPRRCARASSPSGKPPAVVGICGSRRSSPTCTSGSTTRWATPRRSRRALWRKRTRSAMRRGLPSQS
jgi:hypothetical protein